MRGVPRDLSKGELRERETFVDPSLSAVGEEGAADDEMLSEGEIDYYDEGLQWNFGGMGEEEGGGGGERGETDLFLGPGGGRYGNGEVGDHAMETAVAVEFSQRPEPGQVPPVVVRMLLSGAMKGSGQEKGELEV